MSEGKRTLFWSMIVVVLLSLFADALVITGDLRYILAVFYESYYLGGMLIIGLPALAVSMAVCGGVGGVIGNRRGDRLAGATVGVWVSLVPAVSIVALLTHY